MVLRVLLFLIPQLLPCPLLPFFLEQKWKGQGIRTVETTHAQLLITSVAVMWLFSLVTAIANRNATTERRGCDRPGRQQRTINHSELTVAWRIALGVIDPIPT